MSAFVGRPSLVAFGCALVAVRCFGVNCSLCGCRCCALFACWLLFDGCCSMVVVCGLLFSRDVRWLLCVVVCCALRVVCGVFVFGVSVRVVCGLLFVVSCLLVVVWRLV